MANNVLPVKQPVAVVRIEKKKLEEKFIIRDSGLANNFRFKEQRAALRLRIQKPLRDRSRKDMSIELAETSTAPTNRTRVKYVPLEDSLDVEAENNNSCELLPKESQGPSGRGGTSC